MPPIGQGFLLILSQALFSGLYYLLDVYVIEVWPTEVTFKDSSHWHLYMVADIGSQLWFQLVGKYQQDWFSACSTNC